MTEKIDALRNISGEVSDESYAGKYFRRVDPANILFGHYGKNQIEPTVPDPVPCAMRVVVLILDKNGFNAFKLAKLFGN